MVSAKIIAYSCNAAIKRNSKAIYKLGFNIGNVRFLKLNNVVPPSIFADSNGDFGKDCNPANTSNIQNDVLTHTSIITAVIIAVSGLAAHGNPTIPNKFKNFSIIPTELFNINCQIIVAVTGATINGNINATLMILENLLFKLFNNIAIPIPRPISITVLKNAYRMVTQAAFQNALDRKIVIQFCNPMKLYIGILKE